MQIMHTIPIDAYIRDHAISNWEQNWNSRIEIWKTYYLKNLFSRGKFILVDQCGGEAWNSVELAENHY